MSNETKWTPAPWAYKGDDGKFLGSRSSFWVESDDECDLAFIPVMADDHTVCLIAEEDDLSDESFANTRLIASAPELYDALDRCREVLAMLTDPERIKQSRVQIAWAQAVEAEALARAALAKARGEL